jgi:hypothetical protein
MPGWIEKIRKLGWFAVEAALLIIFLCVLLDIIIGTSGVSSYAIYWFLILKIPSVNF